MTSEVSWVIQEPRRFQHNYRLHALLFLLTFFTTTLAGSLFFGTAEGDVAGFGAALLLLIRPHNIWLGMTFSLPTLFILFTHEMGHYLACRRYRVDATLPYFIPAPIGIGTFGAFIKIKEPIPGKAQLFDIGAAGPIAGFIVTIPILLIGIMQAPIVPLSTLPEGGFNLGDPLLVTLFTHLFVHPGEGMTIVLTPFLFAGWIGLLVTALNLLPFGQLDGGHVYYALLGRRQHRLAMPFYIILIAMGIFWPGWLLWGLFLIFLGLRHPRMWDEAIPLDPLRKRYALLVILIFILSFTPIPISG